MAWDSSRPVPWQRLMREWLIYAGIMSVVFLFVFNDGNPAGAIAGVLVSGPLYLALGWVLAKLGYQRKTLKEMRTPQAGDRTAKADVEASPQRVVAPSSRTSGGGNRPSSKKKRRR